ncbi:hypothetical protein Tco_0643338, partial [Tanacetum coccineum]
YYRAIGESYRKVRVFEHKRRSSRKSTETDINVSFSIGSLVVRYKEFEELIQPFEDLERVSQLDRKFLKTTGLDRASVSVMPLSTYLNLGLGELAHTKLTVELADRAVKYPKGIAENVLVGIVVENMDPYVDEGMGEVVVRKPFCEVSCRKLKGLMESLLSTVKMKV